MTELGPVTWPPAPITTERLVLRESQARDRARFVELFASPEVGTYLGGSRPHAELERAVPEVPGRRPGSFVVELEGTMIGVVTLDRRDAEHGGQVRPVTGQVELGYLFLPEAWGQGYATGLRGGPRLVRRRAARRTGGAAHPDRPRTSERAGPAAGVHRSRAVRGVRRRAVVGVCPPEVSAG
ncbi:GNAT family N-acetyltransferase [Actinoalloteichus spitiensis]|uniref:GNAT family N-acetyltransferase n=1 Tax=Actinoalloteichus spitiensis TaxID=252394 RepID=UPI001FE1AE3D|nr:GNAT family N-acetyltransferase [Actinoalloteichus spitiensis]